MQTGQKMKCLQGQKTFKYKIWDSILGIMSEIKQEIAGKRK